MPSIEEAARKISAGTTVNITFGGQRHLEAVVGSNDYKDQYCSSKVIKWTDQIKSLTETAPSNIYLLPSLKAIDHNLPIL